MIRSLNESLESPWAGPVALAVIHLIIALLAFHQAPFTGGDDATYISLARSILERHQYRDIWDPAMPLHTQYPPVFPFTVAIGLAAGLDPVTGLRLIMIAFSTAAVFASSVWLRRVTTSGVAFCAGFFVAISPEAIRLGLDVLSDVPFWLFSILAVLAWLKADSTRDQTTKQMRYSIVVLATALTLLAYFTRSAGAPLLLAVFIWLAIKREARAAMITAAMSAPPIILWWLRGRNSGSGYLAPFLAVDPYNPKRGTVTFGELVSRFAANALQYTSKHIPRLIFGNPRQLMVLGITAVLLVIGGWAMRARKLSLPEIWIPIYLGIVLLWPVTWAGPRFLIPVMPVLTLYAAESVKRWALYSSHPTYVAASLLAVAMLFMIPDLRRQVQMGSTCRARYSRGEAFPCTDPVFSDFFEAAEQIRGNLPKGSVVLSRKPTIFFLHSGYQSRLYPLYSEPDSLFKLADRIGAKYLLIDQIGDLAPRYLHPVILARRDDLCVISNLSLRNAALAKIEIGGPPRPPGSPPNEFRNCPLGSK